MNKNSLKIYFVVILSLLLIILTYFLIIGNQEYIKDNFVTFNKKSGFYDDSITIKLYKNLDLPLGTKIYYTLDGNNPTTKSTKYHGSIKLKKKNITAVYPLKVRAYYNGKYSNILQNTYIIDEDINNNNISIISITSDSKNLYDYNKGIMVPGVTYEKNDLNTPEIYKKGNYSNRGDNWIRPAQLIMFNKNGEKLLNQNIGIGISGWTSVTYDVKSLKIVANYKSNNKFNLKFKGPTNANFSLVNKYNSLRLRSGGYDMFNGNVRSGVVTKLVSQSNFDGYSESERTIVFLNGKFYGVFDIQQNYSDSFLKNKYVLDDSTKIEKYKYEENKIFKDTKIEKFFKADLSDNSNIKKLEKHVDMDNYLLYYAIQVLLNNTDWPRNNFEIWRYTGEYNKNNIYSDGRFRFLIYDVDSIYISDKSDIPFPGAADDTFSTLMSTRESESNLKHVLDSKYYRDKYIMIIEDLLNTSFKEENILNTVDEEYEKIEKQYKKFYLKEEYNNFNNKIQLLKETIVQRDDTLIDFFEKYFNLSNKHKVNVKSNKGIQINFSNQELYQNKTYSNEYYTDIDLRYTYKEYPGYKFKYWLVNDKKIDSKELVIDDKYKSIDEINIEAVAEYQENDNHIIISEVYPNGDADWIKITNTANKNIKLKDYYLSDRKNKLTKYNLPNKTLKSNESIIINGKSNYYSIGDYICNFNISKDETIYLSKNNKIIDSIYIPKMSDIETYGRYDNSNTYKFFTNENNDRKK